jgi:hypothetical protein
MEPGLSSLAAGKERPPDRLAAPDVGDSETIVKGEPAKPAKKQAASS